MRKPEDRTGPATVPAFREALSDRDTSPALGEDRLAHRWGSSLVAGAMSATLVASIVALAMIGFGQPAVVPSLSTPSLGADNAGDAVVVNALPPADEAPRTDAVAAKPAPAQPTTSEPAELPEPDQPAPLASEASRARVPPPVQEAEEPAGEAEEPPGSREIESGGREGSGEGQAGGGKKDGGVGNVAAEDNHTGQPPASSVSPAAETPAQPAQGDEEDHRGKDRASTKGKKSTSKGDVSHGKNPHAHSQAAGNPKKGKNPPAAD